MGGGGLVVGGPRSSLLAPQRHPSRPPAASLRGSGSPPAPRQPLRSGREFGSKAWAEYGKRSNEGRARLDRTAPSAAATAGAGGELTGDGRGREGELAAGASTPGTGTSGPGSPIAGPRKRGRRARRPGGPRDGAGGDDGAEAEWISADAVRRSRTGSRARPTEGLTLLEVLARDGEASGAILEVDRRRHAVLATVSAEGRARGARWREVRERVEAEASRAVVAVLRAAGIPKNQYVVSVVLGDDPTVATLNAAWRGRREPTDVLSLQMVDADELARPSNLALVVLGDICVSLETAERQARERGHDVLDEVRVLLVHGAAHLTGLDHEAGPGEAARQARVEREALAELGWDRVARGGLIELSLSPEGGQVRVGGGSGEGAGERGLSLASAPAPAWSPLPPFCAPSPLPPPLVAVPAEIAAAAVDLLTELRRERATVPGVTELAPRGDGDERGPEGTRSAATLGLTRAPATSCASAPSGEGSWAASGAGRAPEGGTSAAGRPSTRRRPGTSDLGPKTPPRRRDPIPPPPPPTSAPDAPAPDRMGLRQPLRAVALDMDGTLLDSGGQVPASAVRSLLRARAAGALVLLATGKAPEAAAEALRGSGLVEAGVLDVRRGPGVYLQGVLACGPGGEPLVGRPGVDPEDCLSTKAVGVAVEQSRRAGLALVAFLSDGTCATEVTGAGLAPEVRALHDAYREPLARGVADLLSLIEPPRERGAPGAAEAPEWRPVRALKLVALVPGEMALPGGQIVGSEAPDGRGTATLPSPSPGDALTPRSDAASRALERALAPLGASVTVATAGAVEVVPRGADKASAVSRVLESFGFSLLECAALGDGANDLELLRAVGVGVAVGNARPEVKEAADLVVPPNDSDGVAIALEALFYPAEDRD